jgi:hypothetical protein
LRVPPGRILNSPSREFPARCLGNPAFFGPLGRGQGRRILRLPLRDGRPDSIHGIGGRPEIARVEVGVGAEVDGRIVAECGSGGRDGNALLSHEARRRVPQHRPMSDWPTGPAQRAGPTRSSTSTTRGASSGA